MTWDPTNFQYGQLNDVRVPAFSPVPIKDRSFWSILEEIVAAYYKVSTFNNTGPYKGYVLKVLDAVENPITPAEPIPNPAAAEGWADFLPEAGGKRIKLVVRVPEVHSTLPVPKSLGDQATPEDKKIIDQYDVFVAQYLDMVPPAVNDIVWVDWLQKAGPDWTEPVYIAPINATFPGPDAETLKALLAHLQGCNNTYKRRGATGDPMPGVNAVLEPYQGLPRLKIANEDLKDNMNKNPTEAKDWVVNEKEEYNKVAYEEWKKALKQKGKWRLKTWYGHVKGNGELDVLHTPVKRSALIVAPYYFDHAKPWELIYWFHGLEGFATMNFTDRYVPQINRMIEQNRNFVLVIPELPWSMRGTGKKNTMKEKGSALSGSRRQEGAWDSTGAGRTEKHVKETLAAPAAVGFDKFIESAYGIKNEHTWGGNLVTFHNNVTKIIAVHLSGLPSNHEKTGDIKDWITPPEMVSIFGHSNGGSAIARAAQEGALKIIKPDRIFFSDSDYKWKSYDTMTAIGATWKHYVKDSPKRIWMTTLTVTKTPTAQAKKFFTSLTTKTERDKHDIYWLQMDPPGKKDHGWCGANALLIVHPEHAKKTKAKVEAAIQDVFGKTVPGFGATEAAVDEAASSTTGADADAKNVAEDAPAESPEEADAAAAEAAAAGAEAGAQPVSGSATSPTVSNEGEARTQQGPPSSASVQPKQSTTQDPPKPDWKTAEGVPYKENRVYIEDYGGTIKDKNSNLLVPVSPSNGRKAHVLVAKRWDAMKKAAKADGYTLSVGSAWRPHKWKSRAEYEAKCIKEYGSVKDAAEYIAFNSPHETGMALDITGHGMTIHTKAPKGPNAEPPAGPRDRTQQKAYHKSLPVWKWLHANAYKYGFTPYKSEAWHWEVRLPAKAWATGEEYTDDYSVRVTDIGGQKKPQSGTSTTGGGTTPPVKPCVTLAGGNSVPGAGGRPVIFATPTAVPGLGKKLFHGPLGGEAAFGGQSFGKFMKIMQGFCIHETAGWPSNIYQRIKKQPTTTCGVTWWHCTDGNVMKTAHTAQFGWHCSGGSRTSTMNEMTNMGPVQKQYRHRLKAMIAQGIHVVTNKPGKDWGDILADGPKILNAPNVLMLPTPQTLESLWQTIYSIHKHPEDNSEAIWKYGGKKGNTVMNLQIQFPCVVKSSGKFYFTRWAGMPVGGKFDQKVLGKWWMDTEPAGIFCHWNCGHHGDGMNGAYYCYARADGFSHADAYYAMVGAACSTKMEKGEYGKMPYAPLPNKAMVAIGQDKYPFPLTAKTYVSCHKDARQWHWGAKSEPKKPDHPSVVEWKKLVAANPSWIGKMV